MPKIELVVFDIGETLVSEERIWRDWARWLGVSDFMLFAALGAVIAERRPHREAFQIIRPGLDFEAERARRRAAGEEDMVSDGDLYPDAPPTLTALAAQGYRIAFSGNQPAASEAVLQHWPLKPTFVGSSESWGVQKPSLAFFEKIIALSGGLEPGQIAYVGDRIDNDVLPAQALGLRAVFIERGPWALIQARWPEAAEVRFRISSLSDLPDVLGA